MIGCRLVVGAGGRVTEGLMGKIGVFFGGW